MEDVRTEFRQGRAVAVLLPIADVLPLNPLIHKDEQARAARFKHQRDADAHLAGRHLVRAILGIKPPVQPFSVTAKGRPELPDASGAFSISHSGRWVAVAACPQGLIGIDVEAEVRGDLSELTRRVCHPNEVSWLSAQSDSAAAFLRIWTRKEAVLKAHGTGIATDLTAIDIRPAVKIGAELEKDGLQVGSVALPNGALAIAAQERVTLFRQDAKDRF